MFDLGAVVPLGVTVRDADGTPADAGEVRLTLTLPDGATEEFGPVAPSSPGVYGYDYATVQAGLHRVRWVATGANASAYTDAFGVEPAEGTPFISLADARDHLRKAGMRDDGKLRGFVTAACAMVEDRMGHVTPVTITEDATVRQTLVTRKRPVIEVVEVLALPGLTPVDGWKLISPEGVISLPGGGDVRVVYRAGRSPISGHYRLAALELAAHLWRESQVNGGGGRLPVGQGEQYIPGTTYALPYSVRQLLGLDRRPRDEVLVG